MVLDPNVETWIFLDDYPDYEISSFGRIRRGEKINRQTVTRDGYLAVCIRNKQKQTHNTLATHVLVAKTFIGPNPGGSREFRVVHLDGDLKNNRVNNLEWQPWIYRNQFSGKLVQTQATIVKNRQLGPKEMAIVVSNPDKATTFLAAYLQVPIAQIEKVRPKAKVFVNYADE